MILMIVIIDGINILVVSLFIKLLSSYIYVLSN